MPKQIKCGSDTHPLDDPCKILFHVKISEEGNEHISELIAFQMKKSFHCNIPNVLLSQSLETTTLIGFSHTVTVIINDPSIKNVFTTE